MTDDQKQYVETELAELRSMLIGLGAHPRRNKRRLEMVASKILVSRASEMLALARGHYADVAALTQQEIAIQRKRLAILKQDPDGRWVTEIAELQSAIEVTERHLFAAKKSQVSIEYYAEAALEGAVRQTRKGRNFDALAHQLALGYETVAGKRATVITVGSARGGAFVDSVYKYLSAHATEERGISWPMSRSALAERLRRALYGQGAEKRGAHKKRIPLICRR